MSEKSVIIHGKRISDQSPRQGREHMELWGVTRCNVHFWAGKLLDWTAWWDLHPLTKMGVFNGIEHRRPNAWNWYKQQDGTRPIYMQAVHPDIPGSVAWPLDRMIERYAPPGEKNPNFLCQVGMMMAYTHEQGYKHVVLNGIGTVGTVEHQHLHRDIGYWVGFLRGAGVRVDVESPSTFRCPPRIYGYEVLYADELMEARRQRQAAEDGVGTRLTEKIVRDMQRGRPPKMHGLSTAAYLKAARNRPEDFDL